MSGDLILSEQDRGREVPVSADQVIELRLPENPTTGMRWAFESQTGIDILEDRNDQPGAAAPGAASERVIRLRLRSGEVVLKLTRGQAWETGAAPDATFSVTLTAR